MPIAEFYEREYETIFNRQMTTLHECVWTPGQVQEHILGFDAAFLSNSQLIFDLFPAGRFLPIGIRPSSDNWQEIFDIADRHFPPFCFNLFVQHKRPEFIGSRRGKERSYWKRPYFRYDIDSNQQACLEKLETVSSNDALVTYACAAFHKHQELWEHVTRSTVIQSSNFVRPADLKGHHRYSFDVPGSTGLATSEPEIVENQGFRERFRGHLDASDPIPLSAIIKRAGKIVQETIDTSAVPHRLYNQIMSDTIQDRIKEASVLYSYITVQAFCYWNRTSWSIIAQSPDRPSD